jgi:transcriptional regulator GlxA family with amidase domain
MSSYPGHGTDRGRRSVVDAGRRLFQREFGMGPGRYYQSIRLDVARTLVEETSYSAGEIAARTGFASSACLSRAFSSFSAIRYAAHGVAV